MDQVFQLRARSFDKIDPLRCNSCHRIARFESAQVRDDEIAGEVSPMCRFILFPDDWESGKDVVCIRLLDTIEHEEQRIQTRPGVPAFVLIPGEWAAVRTLVYSKRPHVLGGVGQAQDLLANDLLCRLLANAPSELSERDNWKLFC